MDPVECAYHELYAYTLARADASFITQLVADAFTAQTANDGTKAIAVTFALIGLYLHVDRQFSGRQVQLVHMRLAGRTRAWPTFPLPRDRGAMTVVDVMAAPEGPERDAAVDAWCRSVWDTFRGSQTTVVDLLAKHRII